jgi:hypothetical protein
LIVATSDKDVSDFDDDAAGLEQLQHAGCRQHGQHWQADRQGDMLLNVAC